MEALWGLSGGFLVIRAHDVAEVDPHNSCAQFVAFSGRIFPPRTSEVDPHNSCAQFVAFCGRIFGPGVCISAMLKRTVHFSSVETQGAFQQC